jgi:hypothetical protein
MHRKKLHPQMILSALCRAALWCLLPGILLSGTVLAQSVQVVLPETGLQLTLPAPQWEKPEKKNAGTMILYSAKRVPVTDSLNRGIVAHLSILIEKVEPGLKAKPYSASRRAQVPFTLQKTWSPGKGKKSFPNCIAHLGSYKDATGLLHRICVVYAVHQGKGIQIILDGTDSVWPTLKPEFLAIAESLSRTPTRPK